MLSTVVYSTGVNMLNDLAPAFRDAFYTLIGAFLPYLLPLFALGLGWAIFREVMHQVVDFFAHRDDLGWNPLTDDESAMLYDEWEEGESYEQGAFDFD